MRRILLSATISYLLVAFSFIILTVLNASEQDDLVILLAADARVVVVMSLIGIAATIVLALRILADGIARREIDRRIREPRRKSDVTEGDHTG
jgi:hypothetical protein